MTKRDVYKVSIFVVILQKIIAHFECILKVVNSLVSTLRASGSDKSLKMLSNSEMLVTTVIRSCDCLLEHYQNNQQKIIIERLQSPDVEPYLLKEEVI